MLSLSRSRVSLGRWRSGGYRNRSPGGPGAMTSLWRASRRGVARVVPGFAGRETARKGLAAPSRVEAASLDRSRAELTGASLRVGGGWRPPLERMCPPKGRCWRPLLDYAPLVELRTVRPRRRPPVGGFTSRGRGRAHARRRRLLVHERGCPAPSWDPPDRRR